MPYVFSKQAVRITFYKGRGHKTSKYHLISPAVLEMIQKNIRVKHIAELAGRVLLSFIFLFEAYDSVFFFKETKLKMNFYGISWNQDLLLYGAITFLVLGAVMVLIGYRASLGASLLLLYWIPVTFIVHDFWNVPFTCDMHVSCKELNIETDELYRRMEAVLFMKNLAIIGGLLMILVNGTGKYSIRRLFATTRVPGT